MLNRLHCYVCAMSTDSFFFFFTLLLSTTVYLYVYRRCVLFVLYLLHHFYNLDRGEREKILFFIAIDFVCVGCWGGGGFTLFIHDVVSSVQVILGQFLFMIVIRASSFFFFI